MNVLNLDPTWVPLPMHTNFTLVRDFKFPGGEVHVQLPTGMAGRLVITTRLNDSDAILRLLLACEACASAKKIINWTDIIVPYMPYARQDRAAVDGEPVSADMMAELLAMTLADRAWTLDLHSQRMHLWYEEWGPDRSDPFRALPADAFFNEVRSRVPTDIVICAPDLGAATRLTIPATVYATKHRDPLTGRLFIEEIEGDVDGRPVLICDDICDGGATFIQLAERLHKEGALSVKLAVCHGIFSNDAVKRLNEAGIIDIFTTDSIRNETPGVTTLPVPMPEELTGA